MKKLVSIVLVVLMVSVMAGCADMEDSTSIYSIDSVKVESTSDDVDAEKRENVQTQSSESIGGMQEAEDDGSQTYAGDIKFVEPDWNLFAGKIREICCGVDGRLLIRADKLYLYDASEGIVEAEVDLDEYQDIRMFAYASGYVIVGNSVQGNSGAFVSSTGGMKCICRLYDSQLGEEKETVLSDLISNEVIVSLNAVDVSSDGNKIVFATLGNVYLYQTDTQRCEKLLSMDENTTYGNRWISNIEYLAFVSDDLQLAFVGSGIPLGSGGSIPSYGMFDVTGKNLVILGDQSYSVSEMLVGNGFMYLPSVFNKADGTLLKYSFANGEASSINFRNAKEGKDGIYTSFDGTYFATALLDGKLVVNIYDRNGVHLKEYVVDSLDASYFYRIPQIILCENSRVCVVVLGGNQMDMGTEIICFEF